MKFSIPHFKIGQTVWGQIEEVCTNNDIIVSFFGDLIRVSNQTHRKVQVGEKIQLVVRTVNPLSFRITSKTHRDLKKVSINCKV